jgi:hypothetical protein
LIHLEYVIAPSAKELPVKARPEVPSAIQAVRGEIQPDGTPVAKAAAAEAEDEAEYAASEV